MSLRRRLLSLLRDARLAPAGRLATPPPSRRFSLSPATAGVASTSGSSSSGGANFSNKGSKYGAILIGPAAVFLGLSSNTVLAQDDSVAPAATSEQSEANDTALHRIEDGSVISNEHTIKWRICADKAKDCLRKGKVDEAEKLFKAALQEAKEGFGPRHVHVASALNNLAVLYGIKEELEKAEPLYAEAIEMLVQLYGPDDIRSGSYLNILGQFYDNQRKFDQAQTCYERALKIQGRVIGLGHPDYANTMYLLAKALSQQRKGNEAEAVIRESIRILEEAGLGESPMCIQKMDFLSSELLKSGRLAEAENLHRKILQIMELSEGWDSLYTTRAAENLSVILQSIGNLKESEEILERCLAVRRKILSEDHVEVAGILERLAMLTIIKIMYDLEANNHLSRSDLVKVKEHVNDSIRITEAILNPSRENQGKLESTIAMEGEKIQATKVLLRALEVVVSLEGAKEAPGMLARLLRLPLEHLKHGYFKDDGDDTTLRIHLKNNSEKFDYEHGEQALRRCISLYNEPHTRDIVSKAIRQYYVSFLSRIVNLVQKHPELPNEPRMKVLLAESQQIIKELGEEM